VLAVLAAAGCGYVAEPLPPLANVPNRVADLSALQRGTQIVVRFTVPTLTTEGIALKPPLHLDLRAGPGPEPFNQEVWAANATKVTATSIKEGVASYEIPATTWVGKDVLIAVDVSGTNGKESGWSKLTVVPVVPAPERPADVQVESTAKGIRLTWQAHGNLFRIFRSTNGGPLMQVTEVPGPPWTDETTQFGQKYDYQVQTIVKLPENREAESERSAEISLTPEDKFPPATPAGLRAAEAPNSIELSWEPDTESDFAGYRLYRSVSGAGFQQIADPDLPSYSDRNVEHGKTYRYQVSAVDRIGNESSPSMPVEITFP